MEDDSARSGGAQPDYPCGRTKAFAYVDEGNWYQCEGTTCGGWHRAIRDYISCANLDGWVHRAVWFENDHGNLTPFGQGWLCVPADIAPNPRP